MSDLNLDEPAQTTVSRRTVLTGALGAATLATLSPVGAAHGVFSNPGRKLDSAKGGKTMSTVATKDGAQILGEVEDIARVVAFLGDPDSGWINGQVVRLNGGGV
jgi:NAD(P)-dependent dehydrogenase (short-subunit alcohol dehydrogenase family)